MSNYATLKAAIQSAVYTNGSGDITGAGLQSVLLQIVNTVGDGYVFKGVANAGTAPGTPDENVLYIAPEGTYTNFGGSYTVGSGEIGLFTYNGSWTKTKIQVGLSIDVDDNPTAGSTGLVSSAGVHSEDALVGFTLSLPMSRRGGTTSSKFLYGYNGGLYDLSANADAACWETVDVNVSDFVGKDVVVNVHTDLAPIDNPTAGNWNLIVDSGGNILERWQQTTMVKHTIPADAATMKLSNCRKDKDGGDFNGNPFVILGDIFETYIAGSAVSGVGLEQYGWTQVAGVFISGTNGKFAVGSNMQYQYVKVNEGESYGIRANASYAAHYIFLHSITQNPSYLQDSDNVGFGIFNAGTFGQVTIPSGCNYLAVSVMNSGMMIKPEDVLRMGSVQDALDILGGKQNTVYCVPVYGQSLATGVEASRITSWSRFPDNCANTDDLTLSFSQSQETSSFGLMDSLLASIFEEDGVQVRSQGILSVSFATGVGASSITSLNKGNAAYTTLMSKISAIHATCAMLGKRMVVPAFCWLQGEHDRADEYTNNYKGLLSQLRTDIDTDVKAITGQSEDVHCVCYQTNQLSLMGSTHFVPTDYASGDGGALMSVPQAQYELIRDSQYFDASAPIYPMKFVSGANIHIDSVSQKLMGYFEGLAVKRIIDGDGCEIGLYPVSFSKLDTTHVRVNMHVPYPPLVIDTDSVTEASHYGFSVINSSDTDIISSVTLHSHYSENYVIIETSENCTGAKLRYGVNGTYGESGYLNGSRGNLRDSMGDAKVAYVNGMQIKMNNWLYFFEYTI